MLCKSDARPGRRGERETMNSTGNSEKARTVEVGESRLEGLLTIPDNAKGLVIFAHGSGSSRLSPRNAYAARALNGRALATLQFDLLTEAEAADRGNVFDIPLLGRRVAETVRWAGTKPSTAFLPIGLFGASTGAAAALTAAAALPELVMAVVSRGGRPDLAGPALDLVRAPTLLIVGGDDDIVIELNRRALEMLACEKQLTIVPGATHLFEEPGTLDAVIVAAGDWFEHYLVKDKA